jgi:hypothetical protein
MWSSHPSIILVVFWAVVLGIHRARHGPAARFGVPCRAVAGAGFAVLLTFVAVVIWYTCQVTYFDPAEPTITAVASVFGDGKELYPAIDAPERYVLIYGPVLFIAHAAAMALFGKGILVSKAIGALAIGASLWLGYRVFSHRAGRLVAIAATSACALVYLDFGNVTFWTRPDPLLILCAVVAL